MTETRKLGDVVEIDRQQREGNDGIYVGMEDIESRTGRFTGDDTPRQVKSATFLFCEDHVLYGRLRPYLNKVLCPDFSGHCSTEIIPLRPAEVLDRRYLFHWLTSPRVVEAAKQTSTGARMPRANMNHLLELPMALPPLDEQRRIVAKLDEVLGEIDALKRNRQAKIEAFDAVKSSMLNDLLQTVPGTRETVPLAELATHFSDGDWIESKDQSIDGIRLIQTGNVGDGVFLDRRDKARYISKETFERLKCTAVLPRDCLISRLPDPVGRACIVPEVEGQLITAVDCTIVRFDSDRVLPEYFIYYAMSREYGRTVDSLTTGATRSRISRKNLGLIPIDVPPLDEQRRIVATLDEAVSAIDAGKGLLVKQLDLSDAMSSSVLAELLVAA